MHREQNSKASERLQDKKSQAPIRTLQLLAQRAWTMRSRISSRISWPSYLAPFFKELLLSAILKTPGSFGGVFLFYGPPLIWCVQKTLRIKGRSFANCLSRSSREKDKFGPQAHIREGLGLEAWVCGKIHSWPCSGKLVITEGHVQIPV